MKRIFPELESKTNPLPPDATPPLQSPPLPDIDQQHLFSYLSDLLDDLESVEQSPRYHPEGNALFHSLQVFQLACKETQDAELWAAALLHDVGKSVTTAGHAALGRDMLRGLLSPKICWLVEHHLLLLTQPGRTRRRLQGTRALQELQQLRRWDLGGREMICSVPTPGEAITTIFKDLPAITSPRSDAIYWQNPTA